VRGRALCGSPDGLAGRLVWEKAVPSPCTPPLIPSGPVCRTAVSPV